MCGIIIKTNTTLTKIRTINVAPAAIFDGRLADVEDNDVVEDDEDETLKDNSNYTAARQAIDDDDAEVKSFDLIRFDWN